MHAAVARSTFRSQKGYGLGPPFEIGRGGRLKRIYKDAVRAAGAIQEKSPADMLGGQGADFLRGVAFWSIRSLGVLR